MKDVPILSFTNPEFHTGRNITVRRGIKWAMESHARVEGLDGVFKLHPVVIRFRDIVDDMIADEHDPECRTYAGLLGVVKDIYSDFQENEIVTVVSFYVPEAMCNASAPIVYSTYE